MKIAINIRARVCSHVRVKVTRDVARIVERDNMLNTFLLMIRSLFKTLDKYEKH
jgi:hypothetical protein